MGFSKRVDVALAARFTLADSPPESLEASFLRSKISCALMVTPILMEDLVFIEFGLCCVSSSSRAGGPLPGS